ncbi:MAG: hypothetical protein R6W69_16845 [Anaerolineales bacterium]
MTRKLRIPLIFLLLSVLALGGLGFQVAAPFFQADGPTPEPGERPDADEIAELIAQSGSTNGIMFLGLVIFLLSIVPMFLLRKDW